MCLVKLMMEQEKLAARNSHRLSATESLILDSEITDVLFHFDAIMDALEKEMHEPSLSPGEVTPSPTPQSPPTTPTHITEPTELTKLSLHQLNSSRSNLPSVKELQKQFLQSKVIDATKTATVQSRDFDMSRVRVNVQNIIQQLHVKGSSTSPEPLPGSHRPRSNSKSIMEKISVLTTGHQGEPSEDTRRSYTPPLKRNKIKSPFLERSKSQDFESILSEAFEQETSHPLSSTQPRPTHQVAEPSHVTVDTVTGLDQEEDCLSEQLGTGKTFTEVANNLTEDLLEQTAEVEEMETVSKSSPIKAASEPCNVSFIHVLVNDVLGWVSLSVRVGRYLKHTMTQWDLCGGAGSHYDTM